MIDIDNQMTMRSVMEYHNTPSIVLCDLVDMVSVFAVIIGLDLDEVWVSLEMIAAPFRIAISFGVIVPVCMKKNIVFFTVGVDDLIHPCPLDAMPVQKFHNRFHFLYYHFRIS